MIRKLLTEEESTTIKVKILSILENNPKATLQDLRTDLARLNIIATHNQVKHALYVIRKSKGVVASKRTIVKMIVVADEAYKAVRKAFERADMVEPLEIEIDRLNIENALLKEKSAFFEKQVHEVKGEMYKMRLAKSHNEVYPPDELVDR